VSVPKFTGTELIIITLAVVCPFLWCMCFLIIIHKISLFLHFVIFKLMYSLDVFYGYRLNWGHSLMSTSKKEATLEVFIWKWPGRMWQNVLEAHGLLLSMTWVHATTLTVILDLMLLNLLSLHLLLQRDCVREGLNQLHLCLPHSQFREKGFLHCPLDHKC
jgi:hypothetical protein